MLRRLYIICLTLALVLSLCSCSKKDEVETDTSIEQIQDTQEIEEIDTSTVRNDGEEFNNLEEILIAMPEIHDNFDIDFSSYKKITRMNKGEYALYNQYNAICKVNEYQNSYGDDLEFTVQTVYKAGADFIDSLSLTCNFINEYDMEAIEKIIPSIIDSIIGGDVSSEITKITYNAEPKIITHGDKSINIYRCIDDMTAITGQYILTYTINNISNAKVYVDRDLFSPSSHVDYVLFNTGIIAYQDKVSTMETKIAKVFSDYATGEVVEMTDLRKDTPDDQYSKGSVEIEIADMDGGISNFKAKADEVNFDKKLSIEFTTLPKDSKLDAYYEAEDMLLFLIGKEVGLDEYYENGEINILIEESGLNTDWGYPLRVTGSMDESDEKYVCVININTEASTNTEANTEDSTNTEADLEG